MHRYHTLYSILCISTTHIQIYSPGRGRNWNNSDLVILRESRLSPFLPFPFPKPKPQANEASAICWVRIPSFLLACCDCDLWCDFATYFPICISISSYDSDPSPSPNANQTKIRNPRRCNKNRVYCLAYLLLIFLKL